jgi:hypothetical protein
MGIQNKLDLTKICFAAPALALLFFLIIPDAEAEWFSYEKPGYKGRVISAETKESIRGAVVAVYYETRRYPIFGGEFRCLHAGEVLTGENGDFEIPPFKTTVWPFTGDGKVGFIIYKPGYASYPDHVRLCVMPEVFFSAEKSGAPGECRQHDTLHKFVFGEIELPGATSGYERRAAVPGLPFFCESGRFPILNEMIREELATVEPAPDFMPYEGSEKLIFNKAAPKSVTSEIPKVPPHVKQEN